MKTQSILRSRPCIMVLLGACLAVVTGCSKAEEKPIARADSLEFRILANEVDDKDAIEASRKFFEKVGDDPKTAANLKELADKGKPPPSPKPPEGKDTWPNGYIYSWVEMGRPYCR